MEERKRRTRAEAKMKVRAGAALGTGNRGKNGGESVLPELTWL